MSNGLNFFAIVVAELVFDLLKRLAHSFRDAQAGKSYGNESDCRKDYECHLQTEISEQRREDQADNKVGNPQEDNAATHAESSKSKRDNFGNAEPENRSKESLHGEQETNN